MLKFILYFQLFGIFFKDVLEIQGYTLQDPLSHFALLHTEKPHYDVYFISLQYFDGIYCLNSKI